MYLRIMYTFLYIPKLMRLNKFNKTAILNIPFSVELRTPPRRGPTTKLKPIAAPILAKVAFCSVFGTVLATMALIKICTWPVRPRHKNSMKFSKLCFFPLKKQITNLTNYNS